MLNNLIQLIHWTCFNLVVFQGKGNLDPTQHFLYKVLTSKFGQKKNTSEFLKHQLIQKRLYTVFCYLKWLLNIYLTR